MGSGQFTIYGKTVKIKSINLQIKIVTTIVTTINGKTVNQTTSVGTVVVLGVA